MSFNYYICTGEDPTNYEDIKPKVSNPMFYVISTCSIMSTGIKKGGSEPVPRGQCWPRSSRGKQKSNLLGSVKSVVSSYSCYSGVRIEPA